jgi:hypothetical protein
VKLLRYASFFVITTYSKHASFLKTRKPCILSFLPSRPVAGSLRMHQVCNPSDDFINMATKYPKRRSTAAIPANEVVSQFVIPFKTRVAGREPESRNR